MASSVIITDSQTLSGALFSKIASQFRDITIHSTVFITSFNHSAQISLESASISRVISIAQTPGHHSRDFLSEIFRILSPSGNLFIQEPVAQRPPAAQESASLGTSAALLQTSGSLEKSLLYTGYVDVSTSAPFSEAGLAAAWTGVTPVEVGSLEGPLIQLVAIQSKKPTWEAGKSFPLKSKSRLSATGTGRAVKLSLDDSSAGIIPASSAADPRRPSWLAASLPEEEDLVDEDSLLTEEDLAPPPAPAAASDCSDVRVAKKACKNCSCGRAELEKEEASRKVTVDQINNPQSACGSCGLGDAFRCAGCPYKGLPPFKLGEKISLSNDFLSADA